MDELVSIWQKTLDILKEEITSVSFNTWIKPIKPIRAEDDYITISVPDEMIRTMIEKRYLDLIANALLEITKKYFKLNVILIKEDIFEDEEPNVKISKSFLNPKYVFDNFIVGNSNRFAHAASLAVAEAPAFAYNPLFIWGGVGLGKTHLMHAIGSYVLENNSKSNVMVISAETFTNDLINSIKDNKNSEFREKYRSIDVLLVDDIQFIAGKSSTEEEFFHTFNTLHQSNKQIVLTSDRPPKEIQNLTERLRSRFEWGLICDIQAPDYETRVAILKKKAQDDGIFVSDEIFDFIASKVKSNIRELEGAFNTIVAYRGLVSQEISLEVAEQALKNYDTSNIEKNITVQSIIEATAKYFRIRPDDIRSARRTKDLANARQIAMYLCRNFTNTSYKKMGELFGDRDHTTILHGIRKVESLLETDEETKTAVNVLTEDIKGN